MRRRSRQRCGCRAAPACVEPNRQLDAARAKASAPINGRWRRLDRGADGWASFAGPHGWARCFMQSRPVRISGVLRTCADRRAHQKGRRRVPPALGFGNRAGSRLKEQAMAGGGHDHAAGESAGRPVGATLGRLVLASRAAVADGPRSVLMVPASWLAARLYRSLSSDVEELLPRRGRRPSSPADELRRPRAGAVDAGGGRRRGAGGALPAAGERLTIWRRASAPIRPAWSARARGRRRGASLLPALRRPLCRDDDLVTIRAASRRASLGGAAPSSTSCSRTSRRRRSTSADLRRSTRPASRHRRDRGALLRRRGGGHGDVDRGDRRDRAASKGARDLMARVRADIARLGGAQRYAPGCASGSPATSPCLVEELTALSEDLGISTVIVVSAVLGVIVLFFGWWIAIPALLLPLRSPPCVVRAGGRVAVRHRPAQLQHRVPGIDRRRQRDQLRHHLAGPLRGEPAPRAPPSRLVARGGRGARPGR